MQYEVPRQPPRQRLARSTREKMWAGVAGGMAEYFDLDPVVVRLLWIAATILTAGLAIPVYILMWWVMPRQDEAPAYAPTWAPPTAVSDPVDVLGAVTARTAADAGAGEPAVGYEAVGHESAVGANPGYESTVGSPTGYESTVGASPGYGSAVGASPGYGSGTSGSPGYMGSAVPMSAPPHYPPATSEHRRRRQKTAGVILVALGMLILGSELGIFSWYAWRYFWPILLIVLGAGMLFRQGGWRR